MSISDDYLCKKTNLICMRHSSISLFGCCFCAGDCGKRDACHRCNALSYHNWKNKVKETKVPFAQAAQTSRSNKLAY